MRIAMLGAGAVAGHFGGRLAHAGENVMFIARGAHLRAMRQHGLRVDSVLGDFMLNPVQATDDPRRFGAVAVVVVAVKAWQVQAAAAAVRPLVGPVTYVVPLQNGVEAPEQLARVLGCRAVAGGVCWVVSYLTEPGRIRHIAREPLVTFGETDGRVGTRPESLRDSFARAGVAAEIAPDIQAALWNKLLFIAPCSGIGVLTRVPIGAVAESARHPPDGGADDARSRGRDCASRAQRRGTAVRPR